MNISNIMQRHGWQFLSGLLILALIGVLFFFGAFGRTADTLSSDNRTRLLLSNAERDYVLAEMRDMLVATQVIMEATLAEDFPRAAAAARNVGMAYMKNIPAEIHGPLIGKLPIEFKQLGFSVHKGMDVIALDAEALGDQDHTFRQLAELMNKCIACHAAYTVLPPVDKP
jgi:hypothetical protein